jgi:two-component system CheB/CheR fusion protein
MHAELEKKVEQRTHDLSEANQNLQNTNSELEQFAYVASHDLQEPLRKIRTFADKLQQSGNALPEKINTYVVKIFEASERMTRLIDDLLNFSRTSAKTMAVKTDLNLILKDVLIDFEEILAQTKGKVISGKLPVLPAIPIQITQLFHNLISNALKFAKEDKPPRITVRSRVLTREELKNHERLDPRIPYVEIAFTDNGVGFSQAFAEQIFIIFQRAHSPKRFQGTGIGLALCRKIVNNHNGEIYAISQENKGASFHVILPMQ